MITAVHSLSEIGTLMGYKPKQRKQKEKFVKCRACGGKMRNIEGTNVWICDNPVEKEKFVKNEAGEKVKTKVTEACGHRYIAP